MTTNQIRLQKIAPEVMRITRAKYERRDVSLMWRKQRLSILRDELIVIRSSPNLEPGVWGNCNNLITDIDLDLIQLNRVLDMRSDQVVFGLCAAIFGMLASLLEIVIAALNVWLSWDTLEPSSVLEFLAVIAITMGVSGIGMWLLARNAV